MMIRDHKQEGTKFGRLFGLQGLKVVVDATPRSWVGEMAAMEPAKSGVIALDELMAVRLAVQLL